MFLILHENYSRTAKSINNMICFTKDIFFLISKLSQLYNQEQIIKLFIEELRSLKPEVEFYWSKTKESENALQVCTNNTSFGFIECNRNFDHLDNDHIVVLEKAVNMIAIILERLLQNDLLSKKEVLLDDVIEEKTLELKIQNKESLNKNSEIINTLEKIENNESKSKLHLDNSADYDYIRNQELKDAKDATEENQRFITSITEQSPDIIYVYDIVTGKNVYINKNIRELLCYEKGTVPENSTDLIELLVHHDDLNNFYYDDLIKNWKTEYVHNYEYRLKDAFGNWRWFSGREKEFERKNNQVVSLIGVVRDITEQKNVEIELQKAEQKISENHEMLSLFIKNSPINAYIKEVTPEYSKVLFASDNFIDMIGVSSEEMIGKSMQELFPAEFAKKNNQG